MKTTKLLKNAQIVGNSMIIAMMVLSQFTGGVSGVRAASTNPPVITEGASTTLSVDENSLTNSLKLDATGAQGVTLTWSISTPASHGAAAVVNPITGSPVSINYTPQDGYAGSDSLVVQVEDGTGGTANITVNVTVNGISPTATVAPTDTAAPVPTDTSTDTLTQVIPTATDTPVPSEPTVVKQDANRAPVITEGASTSVTMSQNGYPTSFALNLHATDADNDTLTWSIANQASHGTASASGTGNSVEVGYTPEISYTGSDSFVVQVDDGNGGTATINVNVTISSGTSWNETAISNTDPFPWSYYDMLAAGDAMNNGHNQIYLAGGTDFHDAQIWSYEYSGGSWQGQNILTTPGYNTITGMVIGDSNNDGKNEFIYGDHTQGNTGPGPLFQRIWNGSSWDQSSIFGGIGDWTYPDGIEDLDQDGKNELAATVSIDYHATNLPYLFKYGSGAWNNQAISPTVTIDDSHIAWLGDFDGDGNQELVRYTKIGGSGNYVTTDFSMIKWNGAAWQESEIGQLTGADFGLLGWQSTGAAGDLDSDGRDELAVAYWRDDNNDGTAEANLDSIVVRVFDFSNGTWSSNDVAVYPVPGIANIQNLVIGDANNDGLNEIYTAGDGGLVRMIANVGNTWNTSVISNSYTQTWRAAAINADTNGDNSLVLEGRNDDGSDFTFISLHGGNNPPVITEGNSTSVTMSRNGSPASFNLTLHATDSDNDLLTWSIASQANHGTASAGGTGGSKDISYTPNTDYTGSDSFVVQVDDGNGGMGTITVNVNILPTTPMVAITAPAAGATVNGSETISFTDDETTAPECSVDNDTWVACNTGITTLSDVAGFAGLSDGSFTLYLQDTDANGNIGSTSESLTKVTFTSTPAILQAQSVGTSSGTLTYTGVYNTLYVGLTGNSSSEDCWGTIDSMVVESLDGGPSITEEFDSDAGFSQTTPNIYISNGQVHWHIYRNGGEQYLYHSIPEISGTVRLIVRGQVDAWHGNCMVRTGIGDSTDTGVSINFGDYGNGCSLNGAVITANGVSLDYTENPACVFPGNWLWINPSVPYTAALTIASGNTPPFITEGDSTSVTMSKNSSPNAFALTLHAMDADNDPLTWSISSAAGHGTASVDGTGNLMDISYTPNTDYAGSDSFVVHVDDGNGGTDSITVNVNITWPTFAARPNQDRVEGWNWPLGATITLEIYDPSDLQNPDFSETQIVQPSSLYSNQTWFDFELHGTYDLKPDDLVTIGDGVMTKQLTVTNVAVTGVDVSADIVNGTATPGSTVTIYVCSDTGCGNELEEPTDSDGNWSANYQGIVDIKPGTTGEAFQTTDDGDRTMFGWYTPYIDASLNSNWVHGQNWPEGTPLTMTIDDPSNGPGDDYTATSIWGNFQGNDPVANFDLDDFRLKPGDIITISGNGISQSLTLQSLKVTDVNVVNDTVSGTGVSGHELRICANVPNNCVNRYATVGEDGNWSVDFQHAGTRPEEEVTFDIQTGSNGWVADTDQNGNLTWYDWSAPRPWIQANVNGRWVQARQWPLGADLTMTINGSGNYTGTEGLNGSGSDPLDTSFMFNNVDLHIGDVILITDGTNSKSSTVSDLQVTGFDLEVDTVSGIATPGSRVQVCVNLPNNCISRWVNADAITGEWSVTYSSRHDPQDDSANYILKTGDTGWASGYDNAGDQTWFDWVVPNPVLQIHVGQNRVEGVDWLAGTSVTLTIDDPSNGVGVDLTRSLVVNPDGTVLFNDLDGLTLAKGMLLTMTDGHFTRSRTVPEQRILGQGGWLDEIDISTTSSDSAISQIQAGEIDLFAGGLPPASLPSIQSAGLNSSTQMGITYSLLFNPTVFNDSSQLNPFSDRKIREAMNGLVDRNYINQQFYAGSALPKWFAIDTQGPDYADLAGTAAELENQYAYNLQKASQVVTTEMTLLGATKDGSGNWMYNGEPVTLNFLIRNDGDGTRRLVGDYFADQLMALGFTVNRLYKRSSEASPIWMGSDPASGQWNVYTAGWGEYVITRDNRAIFQEMYLDTSIQGIQPFLSNPADPAFQAVGDNLANGNFASLNQRHQMMVQAMHLSLKDSLQVWLVDGQNHAPYQSNVQVGADLGAGIEGTQSWPYTLRFTGTEGGALKWADTDLFSGPWNPIAGSTSTQDQAMYYATESGGLMADPYTGLASPFRITSADVTAQTGLPITKSQDWVNLNFTPQVTIPPDAFVDWNASTQTFITAAEKYPGGLTAKVKSVVVYPSDLFDSVTWQDGSKLSAADFLMPMIMKFDRAMPDSAIYDDSAVSGLNSFLNSFKGFRITSTSPLTLEYYSDSYAKDAELDVTPMWPVYTTGEASWDAIAIANLAEAGGQLTYSMDKANNHSILETNFVGGSSLAILSGYLDQAISNATIPYAATLGAYITADDAVARYTNLKNWYTAHGNFWVGTGPYYLDSASYSSKTLTLLNNPAFPDASDRWSALRTPKVASVDLNGPTTVNVGDSPTFNGSVTYQGNPYPSDEINNVTYLLFNVNGTLVETGQATPVSNGQFQVTLSPDTIAQLLNGSCKIEVVVGVNPVTISTFASALFQMNVRTPHIEAHPTGHWIVGSDWPNGTSLHMIITRSGMAPYEADAVVGPAPWDSSILLANFSLWSPRYDLQGGDVITMAGGGNTVSMAVAAIQVTGVDVSANTVSGTADSGSPVHVWVNGGPGQWVPVDSGGHWTADFSPSVLTPGMNGSATQTDANRNFTQSDWRVQRPWIQVGVNDGWVQAGEWPAGASLTMMINGSGAYTATEQLSGIARDLFDTSARFDNLDLHSGDTLLITDGTNSKSYSITPLQVTGLNLAMDTILGIATPGARLQVCLYIPNNCITRWATADASTGAWSVDYSTTHDPQDSWSIHTLQPGDNGRVTEQNASGDMTWYSWQVPANTPPVITEGASSSVTMSKNGTPTAFSLTLHATDVDSDTLTWSILTGANHGTASASGTGNSKAIGFTPDIDYIGPDSFMVQVDDGHGGIVSITIDVNIEQTKPKGKVRDDYDGDGKSDPVKFDPTTGVVWWLSSKTGLWDGMWMGGDTFQYVSGSDYDGDGKTDPAKFYSGAGTVWWVNSINSSLGGQWLGPDQFTYITGSDFDGDGKADPAKFYPETGTVWWVNSATNSLGGQWLGADSFQYISGSDFDGDGKEDPAKFYPATGTVWWIRSSDGRMDGKWLGADTFNYIQASDFNGDGKTDPAKFYPATGTLWWVRSSDGAMDGAWLGPGTYTVIAGDDFNGDGKTDPAMYNAGTHTLYWLNTNSGIWTNVDMGTGTYNIVNGQ